MADMKFDFQPIKEQGLAGQEQPLVTIFESAFQSLSKTPSEAALDEAAKTAALELQKLISPELPAERKKYLFESIWEVLISIAKHIPHRHRGQLLVVKALQVLDCADPWANLPYFGRCMRDNWVDPTFEADESGDETYSQNEWLNLNSFAARLLGAGLVGWENFAIWQLKHGLEERENLSSGNTVADCKVAVVSEWITQAGPTLLRRCLLEKNDVDEALKVSYRAGELFSGLAGLNLERWGFWKRRLGEVRLIVGEEARASVDQAVKVMAEAATPLAN